MENLINGIMLLETWEQCLFAGVVIAGIAECIYIDYFCRDEPIDW